MKLSKLIYNLSMQNILLGSIDPDVVIDNDNEIIIEVTNDKNKIVLKTKSIKEQKC